MRTKYAFEISAGAVIFFQSNGERKYLLLHYSAGHWDFPKGHIEKGESEIEALKREVKEETGLEDIRILPKFRKEVKYFYRASRDERRQRKRQNLPLNVLKKVVYFIAESCSDEVRISYEHKGYVWLPFEEAFRRITYKSSKDLLNEAEMFLNHYLNESE